MNRNENVDQSVVHSATMAPLPRPNRRRRRTPVATAVAASAATAALLLFLSSPDYSLRRRFRSPSSPSWSSSSTVLMNDDELQDYDMDRGNDVHRRLKSMRESLPMHRHDIDPPSTSVSGPSVVNMFRRAKDRVDDADVPLFLEVPFTSAPTATVRSAAMECYGLVGRVFEGRAEEILLAHDHGLVDQYYVPFHSGEAGNGSESGDGESGGGESAEGDESSATNPKPTMNDGKHFHFIATPHYKEIAQLFNPRHKGRIFTTVRHPIHVAEQAYYSRPNVQVGDIAGLAEFTSSEEYYDNWMTRMLANVDARQEVTRDHYAIAKAILEDKFLIGVAEDPRETLKQRLKLYYGWNELPTAKGAKSCEETWIQKAKDDLPKSYLERRGKEWRIIGKQHFWDMKLYARALHVFGDQKMRMPVHKTVTAKQQMEVQKAFGHLRDVKDPRDSTDLPFFWHIPKASGTTVKETICDCFDLVRTEMIRPPASVEILSPYFLNIDMATPEGIKYAIQNNIAEKDLAGLFLSQRAVEGSTVFTPTRRGRAFTILRHPVKLAVSLFYYRQIATWEPSYRPDWKNMTLAEFVDTDGYYDNWMVRMLNNARLGGLNEGHLELAKSVLRDKFVVGIAEHMDEVFRQLQMYYGWEEKREGCVKFHLHSAPSNKNSYKPIERGGEEWTVVAQKNKFDMALYYYALELFGDQSVKKFPRAQTAAR